MLPWGDIAVLALHVLGAALYVGGTFSILAVNRALKAKLSDAERRAMVRHVGRRAAPLLIGGFLLAALTGLDFWAARGWALTPLMLWKLGTAALALATTVTHIWLGRRETRSVAVAATLGSLTLLSALGLVLVGAALRYA